MGSNSSIPNGITSNPSPTGWGPAYNTTQRPPMYGQQPPGGMFGGQNPGHRLEQGNVQPMFSGGSGTPQTMFGGMSPNAQQVMPMMAQQGQAINLWDLPTTALKMPPPPLPFWQQVRMRQEAPAVEETPYRSPMFAPFGAPQPQPVEQPYVNPIFSMFRRP